MILALSEIKILTDYTNSVKNTWKSTNVWSILGTKCNNLWMFTSDKIHWLWPLFVEFKLTSIPQIKIWLVITQAQHSSSKIKHVETNTSHNTTFCQGGGWFTCYLLVWTALTCERDFDFKIFAKSEIDRNGQILMLHSLKEKTNAI